MRIKSYRELRRLDTLQDRFSYLKLNGFVGVDTFGFDRWMNQQFYRSHEWRQVRQHVIARDLGCDLGVEGFEIHSRLYIHHMNPMTSQEIQNGDDSILDPEFLITTTLSTHNAIPYGDERQLPQIYIPRSAGDTQLW